MKDFILTGVFFVFAFCVTPLTMYMVNANAAQPRESDDALYIKEFLVHGARVTRIYDATTNNTCYVAVNTTGSSIAISCMK